MRHRRIGRSGLLVSEISYGNRFAHRESANCARAALEAGITTFHTAAAWGHGAAEEALAEGLREARRDDIVLCTGVFWLEHPGASQFGLGRKHLMSSLHGSLRRLGTDHVDVFQLWRFDHRTPLEETFLALSDVVREGKVRYVGTAEWTAEQLLRADALANELRVPLLCNHAHYSMLWRAPESQVMPAAARAGIGHFASMPLAQGILTGKYRQQRIPPGSRADNDERGRSAVRPFLDASLLERVDLLRGIAEEAGLTMAQLAIAWALHHEGVASAVVGASRPAQVAENARASGVELGIDVLTQIDQLLGGFVQSDPRLTFTPTQYDDL
ncbi:aryl-alcohol dehydrogenase-like predicted oxidoreductase [Saccharopolyspora erythraea NRRL 2338]|uniref:Oxidoreductase, aldo/keto reductase family n=2 Tax=Saccharopolyspora erythraea TaxID=1836 RepID=A4FC65_SACEN|nr:aldo/keto reductase [Saccharopolyspora erythraea]EQD84475.1 aldo/keto reductase [Saccharopolyspora erythraea D]PFG95401.1 aryl-alcohol dehydrogenase-like predicted oxidoreductase [Saccharopolyspora erythraea NRRL 2338]QRK92040.1 aldo/keto reductase [Saccharopolyspora erythraea]CAM01640.1 oxidoreductase, aldo/keto reductase family [Saccharopolyspora erythraea NRRL 2338]